jgi:iron-only hydrogenase maturation protein HydF
MEKTPNSNRVTISIFGNRNAGKSSLLNAIANQEVSIVSDVKGTTTDPVKKAMEMIPAGPVLFIDTAGIDDEGELGSLRIKKSLQILRRTDIALYIIDALDVDDKKSRRN